MSSPLAGSWLFFHLAACAVLLYNGRYEAKKPFLWYASLGWLLALGSSSFLFASVQGSAATMFVLAAAPSLALCIRKEHLNHYLYCFGIVVVLYAVGIITQSVLHVTYDHYNLGDRYAWPLLDPNNAAVVINMGLIPFFYMTIFRDIRWAVLFAIMVSALKCTGSAAGAIEASFAIVALTTLRYGVWCLMGWVVAAWGAVYAVFCEYPEGIVELATRFEMRYPIWQAAWRLLWVRPWGGVGLGMFGVYYQKIRTEDYTSGWFAHNDLLQFAVEMGIPCALVFVVVMGAILASGRRENIVSVITLLSIFMGSMLEFQLYVPAISLPMGLALAYTMLNIRKNSSG